MRREARGTLKGTRGRAGCPGHRHPASPRRHRTLVFDLNDFDEAAWAPWQWDVKRLVTSVVIGGHLTRPFRLAGGDGAPAHKAHQRRADDEEARGERRPEPGSG